MTEEKQQISPEDVNGAIDLLIKYHEQAGIPFAVVNSSVGLVVSSGNGFELEAALNHAHKTVEMENAQRLFKIRQSVMGPSEEELEQIRNAIAEE